MIFSLRNGKNCLIDDADLVLLEGRGWFAIKIEGHWYAASTTTKRQFMHRVIAGAKKGQIVDHINGDGLDNRRENLRICTVSQNQQNRRVIQGITSKFKGVCWNAAAKKWQAAIKSNGRSIYLGIFEKEEAAALAYDTAAGKLFGEFAATNESLRA